MLTCDRSTDLPNQALVPYQFTKQCPPPSMPADLSFVMGSLQNLLDTRQLYMYKKCAVKEWNNFQRVANSIMIFTDLVTCTCLTWLTYC